MGKHDEEYDFLEDAFRDEPKASTLPMRATRARGSTMRSASKPRATQNVGQSESRDYRGDYRGLGFACFAWR